jgi:hypothetical protein
LSKTCFWFFVKKFCQKVFVKYLSKTYFCFLPKIFAKHFVSLFFSQPANVTRDHTRDWNGKFCTVTPSVTNWADGAKLAGCGTNYYGCKKCLIWRF